MAAAVDRGPREDPGGHRVVGVVFVDHHLAALGNDAAQLAQVRHVIVVWNVVVDAERKHRIERVVRKRQPQRLLHRHRAALDRLTEHRL